jgi:hypothetical protein
MTILNSHEVIQEKLLPVELRYLRQLVLHDRFHRFEGTIDDLEPMMEKWLHPPHRWASGAKALYRRIVDCSAQFNEDECNYIRLALHAGHGPHLVLTDVGNPTLCLILDAVSGQMQRGWINGRDKFAGAKPYILSGMQIVCQRINRPLYEDLVGTGAPPEVVYSSSDMQRVRAELAVLPMLPRLAPSPL